MITMENILHICSRLLLIITTFQIYFILYLQNMFERGRGLIFCEQKLTILGIPMVTACWWEGWVLDEFHTINKDFNFFIYFFPEENSQVRRKKNLFGN